MEKIIEIINAIRGNKQLPSIEMLEPEMDLRKDLGFDSMDLAELTAHIENEFSVDVFEDGIITTVREILEKIKR
ncbi:MAG: acyl carrier protein [Lentimicrobium sp.]